MQSGHAAKCVGDSFLGLDQTFELACNTQVKLLRHKKENHYVGSKAILSNNYAAK